MRTIFLGQHGACLESHTVLDLKWQLLRVRVLICTSLKKVQVIAIGVSLQDRLGNDGSGQFITRQSSGKPFYIAHTSTNLPHPL